MLCCILFFISLAEAQTGNEYNLLIGTYTNNDNTNGIQVYTFNTQTGDTKFKYKSVDITNPSYLAISPDRKYVFSVSEAGEGKGTVNAFSFDPKAGTLTFINSVPSAGDHPCYVSVIDKQNLVFVGNYGSGTLSAIRIKPDGSLDPEIQTIAHEGSSVVQRRQEKPHVHAVVLSPDSRYLFTPDLGTDKVNAYAVDAGQSRPLKAAGETTVKPGSGPRHLVFHPNGKYAYLIQELDATVTAFDYKDGKLTAKQSLTLLSSDFKGKVGAADIHVSPDGIFLYGSNRGDANEITIYSIDDSGKLSYAGRQSTLGKTPRNFAIDPSGNFLLAANQDTNDIIIFRRNLKTGLLTDTGKRIAVDRPVCLKFVAID
jgi:6-phosphogluconolactonase